MDELYSQRIGDILNQLENGKLQEIVTSAVDYASVNGLIMQKDDGSILCAPFTLFPTPVPKHAFNSIVNIANDLNLMIDKISRHPTFLKEHLSEVAIADSFTGNLMEIYDTVSREGLNQQINLGLFRSDYMLHSDEKDQKFLQVELNTIASAFACLGSALSEQHRYIMSQILNKGKLLNEIPKNNASKSFVSALAKSCELHHNQKSVVMMIVLPNEKNSADQRMLEYSLWNDFNVKMIRKTFLDIYERGKLDESKDLVIDGYVVGVSYFRAGYVPTHYPSQKEWDALLKIERSSSIKCPSVAYHLAGSKKIQQILSLPGKVELFVEKEKAQEIRKVFAGQWSLGLQNEETKGIIKEAIEHTEKFVMKPQREGGGNNLWGNEISETLKKSSPQDLQAFILMEKIISKPGKNALIRNSAVKIGNTISEFGIYGAFIGDGNKVYMNEYSGHLCRTKLVGVDEGGVASGYSCLDSPFLF